MADHALGYLAQGLSVFPVCSPVGKGRCLQHGKCANAGKVPLIKWEALQDALPTHRDIERWWHANPSANIGMATGKLSGRVVLDCDSGEARKQAMRRGVPGTPAVWTGKPGGCHFHLKHPGRPLQNFARKLPGLDFRGDGGYVLLPPSKHENGAIYRWADNTRSFPLADVPDWLNALFERREPSVPGEGHEPLDLLKLLNGIPDGQRNDALFRYACKMRGDDVPLKYAELTISQGAQLCRPPYTEVDPLEIVRRVYREYPAGHPSDAEDDAEDDEPAIRPVEIFSVEDLYGMEFKEPRWAIPTIWCEGLTIFAGRPKLGKSWVCLGCGIAIAGGGLAFAKLRVTRGEVLYMALEDGKRRIKARLKSILGTLKPPAGLHFAFDWTRFDEGGLEQLSAWLSAHPNCRLVVIDTYKRVRPKEAKGARLYDADYDALAPVAKLAIEKGVAIIVVFHTRKGEASDPLELISGTLGLAGAADAVAVFKRERGQADASLFITGRDIEERDLALKWHVENTTWELLGDAEEFRLSKDRQEIVDLLVATPGLRPSEIAEMLDRPRGRVKKMMYDMARDGQLRVKEGGRYHPPLGEIREQMYRVGNRGNRSIPTPMYLDTSDTTDTTDTTDTPVTDEVHLFVKNGPEGPNEGSEGGSGGNYRASRGNRSGAKLTESGNPERAEGYIETANGYMAVSGAPRTCEDCGAALPHPHMRWCLICAERRAPL